LQFKLGGGSAPKQLALLLMALLLDPHAAGSAAGRGVLQDALGALLAAADEVEWRRLQGQLLEALAPPGFGPSSRCVRVRAGLRVLSLIVLHVVHACRDTCCPGYYMVWVVECVGRSGCIDMPGEGSGAAADDQPPA
jgi:hypothetical protein